MWNMSKVNNKDTRNFKWVSANQMKGNSDKCHLLMSKDKSYEVITKNYYAIKLIQNLIFDDHVQDISKKVIKKFSALAWAILYLILFWNIITAHWFGSFTASRKMKNVCNLCKMRNCHVMRNSWKKMFLTRETFKVLI